MLGMQRISVGFEGRGQEEARRIDEGRRELRKAR